jgi:hypothetical protein
MPFQTAKNRIALTIVTDPYGQFCESGVDFVVMMKGVKLWWGLAWYPSLEAQLHHYNKLAVNVK